MSYRLMAVLAFGALAAACTATETKTVVAPQPVAVATDSCAFYGYAPGTREYSICVEREAAARRRGRMAADYAQAAIIADSQEACYSYGLTRGTDRYERCVQREVNYRRPA